MSNNRYYPFVLPALCLVLGCASTQQTPQPAAPTPQPEVSQPAEPAPVIEAQSDAPQISEELAALRQSIAQNDGPQIEDLAHRIIDKNASSSETLEALNALARHAMKQQKWDEALLYANFALEKDEQNLESLIIAAQILHAQNKDNEALDRLNQAIGHHPKAAEPLWYKSAILLGFLDVDRALEAAKSAFDLAPNDCNVLIAYADALYAHHDFADAVTQYEKADANQCKLSEQSIQYLAKLYEVHIQDAAKACAAYTRLVAMSPENVYYKASRDYQCGAK